MQEGHYVNWLFGCFLRKDKCHVLKIGQAAVLCVKLPKPRDYVVQAVSRSSESNFWGVMHVRISALMRCSLQFMVVLYVMTVLYGYLIEMWMYC
jgi:hypothetical protein